MISVIGSFCVSIMYQNGVRIPKLDACHINFDKKNIKSATQFHCLQTCSSKAVMRTTYRMVNGINILVGDDPVPIKFGHKGTDPEQDGCKALCNWC